MFNMKYFSIVIILFVNHKYILAGLGAATFVALGFGDFSIAKAGSPIKGQYTTSEMPYWSVGVFDGFLSDACRRGDFIQRRLGSYSIGYIGKRGRGITGIATKYWNLIDRTGLSKPNFTYHFKNQGFSNCKVYVAKIPKKNR
jgi:hypothetical protein